MVENEEEEGQEEAEGGASRATKRSTTWPVNRLGATGTLSTSRLASMASMLNLNVAKWPQLARHLLCLGSTQQWQSCTVMCSGQKAGFLLTNFEVSYW